MKKRLAIIGIVSVFFVLMFTLLFLFIFKNDKDFSKIDLTDINNVMFVAHPDDDILWGGAHLLEENYLVVCVTCGNNKIRDKEFKNVMEKTNDKYILLSFPDRTNGQRDNWQLVRPEIIADVEKILALKDWKLIVTHNPEGEYGHVQHKMLNKIVTYLADKNKLMYFGRYYTKKNMDKHKGPEISPELLEIKLELIDIYESQSFIKTTFDHMFQYENWLTHKEWQGVKK